MSPQASVYFYCSSNFLNGTLTLLFYVFHFYLIAYSVAFNAQQKLFWKFFFTSRGKKKICGNALKIFKGQKIFIFL